MVNLDDEIEFLEEEIENLTEPKNKPWKIAIIDDEEQVHTVTRLILSDYIYSGRHLEFYSAYSAKEGKKLFNDHNDIAVCLLDVVMETESAGLDLVKDIRANDNAFTRIVLRTGQPGQAPEEEVIEKYDINDYKEKTDLTRTKLTTLMHSCLKTYEFIINQEITKAGLEKVLESTAKIFENPFIKEFAEGVMMQLGSLFEFNQDAALVKIENAMAAFEKEHNLQVIAGIGDYDPSCHEPNEISLPSDLLDQILSENDKFKIYFDESYFIASHMGKDNERYLLALNGDLSHCTDLNKRLLSIFCHNAMIAFENIMLNNEIEEAQWEIVYLLGGAVETRSKETGKHISRVSEISELLALKIGLDTEIAELIKCASPLHDVGKIAIPDAILNKPGKLNPDEWEVMKTHAEEGFNMLKNSNKKVIQIASRIAHDHHECWDGSGYPNSKKGGDISIEGRITAVADVFDALCSRRCYKEPWSFDDAFNYMKEGAGTQFDPQIIDVFLKEKKQIMDIYHKNID